MNETVSNHCLHIALAFQLTLDSVQDKLESIYISRCSKR